MSRRRSSATDVLTGGRRPSFDRGADPGSPFQSAAKQSLSPAEQLETQAKELKRRAQFIQGLQRNFESLSNVCQRDREDKERLEAQLAEARTRIGELEARPRKPDPPAARAAPPAPPAVPEVDLGPSRGERDAKAALAKQTRRTTELEKQLRDLGTNNRALMRRTQEAQTALDKALRQVEVQGAQLATAQQDAERLQAERAAWRSERHQLSSELADERDKQHRAAALREQLDSSAHALATEREMLSTLQRRLGEAERQVSAAEERARRAEGAARDQQVAAELARQKASETDQALRDARGRVRELEAEVSRQQLLSVEGQAVADARVAAEKRVEELEEQLQGTRFASEALEACQKELREYGSLTDALRRQNGVLEGQLEGAKEQRAALEAEMQEVRAGASGADTARAAYLGQLQSLTAERDSAVAALEAHTKESGDITAALQGEFQRLKQQASEAQRTAHESSASLSKLELDLAEQRQLARAKDRELEVAAAAADRLREELLQLSNQPSASLPTSAELLALLLELRSTVDQLLRAEEASETAFTCLDCMQLYQQPVTLVPCGHTFCNACVDKRSLEGPPCCKECDDMPQQGLVRNRLLDGLTGKFEFKRDTLRTLKQMSDAMAANPLVQAQLESLP